MFEGKPANRIFFDEKTLEIDRTLEVITESFGYWKELKEIKQKESLTEYEKKLLEISTRYHMLKVE